MELYCSVTTDNSGVARGAVRQNASLLFCRNESSSVVVLLLSSHSISFSILNAVIEFSIDNFFPMLVSDNDLLVLSFSFTVKTRTRVSLINERKINNFLRFFFGCLLISFDFYNCCIFQ